MALFCQIVLQKPLRLWLTVSALSFSGLEHEISILYGLYKACKHFNGQNCLLIRFLASFRISEKYEGFIHKSKKFIDVSINLLRKKCIDSNFSIQCGQNTKKGNEGI